MPWLAPLVTPVCAPTIDIQAPSWQSSRAATSDGLDLTARSPAPSKRIAWIEAASDIGWLLTEHKSSTAWSTARMPVESHSHSGVCTLTLGSRITVRGAISGCAKLSLTCRVVSVHPADALNSPAESVVGTAMKRTPGALTDGRRVLPAAATTARQES